MEGRAPGTPGEDKAVAYIQAQFKAIGLKPGNPDGTYIQNVDLIGYKAHPTASLSARGKTVALKYPDDFIANSRHDRAETKVDNSDIVFVGYGVVAPEYGGTTTRAWTSTVKQSSCSSTIRLCAIAERYDARHEDVQGPRDDLLRPLDIQVRDRVREGSGGGHHHSRDRTGRLSVRVVRRQLDREQFDLVTPDKNMKSRSRRGMDHARQGTELSTVAGQDFDRSRAAATRGFQAVRAPAKATFDVENTMRKDPVAATWSQSWKVSDPQ